MSSLSAHQVARQTVALPRTWVSNATTELVQERVRDRIPETGTMFNVCFVLLPFSEEGAKRRSGGVASAEKGRRNPKQV